VSSVPKPTLHPPTTPIEIRVEGPKGLHQSAVTLLAGVGLTEDLDDPGLAESTLAQRIRSASGADSTTSGGPVFGEQVSVINRHLEGSGLKQGEFDWLSGTNHSLLKASFVKSCVDDTGQTFFPHISPPISVNFRTTCFERDQLQWALVFPRISRGFLPKRG
jgi:hypothetical protein